MRLSSGVRVVAAFEAAKGLLVLAVGFGLLSLVHRNVQLAAEVLVGHFHLNPASRVPRVFLELAGRLSDQRLWLLAGFACGYAGIRLVEAYGLWRDRRWAEWFALASGGLYIPIEVYELLVGVSWLKVGTLLVNVAIVAYMILVLRNSRRDGAHEAH
ncbi:MAG TPA: DUF2127 domain-containing protein [Burkholderiales bacterium]|nr:DUF2127 domain-containing protein [Burkholderiales bacterium]